MASQKKKKIRVELASAWIVAIACGLTWLLLQAVRQSPRVNEVSETLPVPTGLQEVCQDNGTKVRLSWVDDTPGAYSLAINDPDNDTETEWYIPESKDIWIHGDLETATYTATIEPDHDYEWWVMSNLQSDVDETSIQAESSFICLSDQEVIESPSPSPDPSPSPRPSPSDLATPPITFRHDSSTCTSLTVTWDKAANASGYIVELSKNSNYSDVISSGVLQSTYDRYTFDKLDVNSTYYVRISQANIHDYPLYSKLTGIKTSMSCVSPTPAPSTQPKPTNKVTPKPVKQTSPSPLASVLLGRRNSAIGASPIPSIFPQDDAAETQETAQKQSILARFVAWIFTIFGKK